MKTKVFISYSRKDEALAHLLSYILSERDFDCSLDRSTRPGHRFDKSIQGMIGDADVVLVLLTSASAASPWVNQEVGFAIAREKLIWPVALEQPGDSKGMLETIEYYSLLDWSDPTSVGKLLDALASELRNQGHDPYTGHLDRVLTDQGARVRFMINSWKKLAERKEKVSVLHTATFSILGYPDDALHDVSQEGPRGYFELLKDERRAFEELVRMENVSCRMIICPALATERSRYSKMLGTLLDWLRNNLKCGNIEIACGEFPGPRNRHIVPGKFALESYRIDDSLDYRHSVIRYQEDGVRAAEERFNVVWQDIFPGDNESSIKKIESLR